MWLRSNGEDSCEFDNWAVIAGGQRGGGQFAKRIDRWPTSDDRGEIDRWARQLDEAASALPRTMPRRPSARGKKWNGNRRVHEGATWICRERRD